MFKKIVSLLLVLALALSCGFAQAQETYTHPLGFSFTVPEGYGLMEETDAGVTFSKGTDCVMHMEYSSIGFPFDTDTFLSVAAPELCAQYETQFPGCVVANSGEAVTVGEKAYIKQVLEMEIEGTPVVMELYYYLYGADMIMMGMTFSKELMETDAANCAAEVEQVLATFGVQQAADVSEAAAPEAAADFVFDPGMETLSYTHRDGSYSFSYPADMILLSDANVQEILDGMTDESYAMEGMDTSVIQQNIEQVRGTDMVMVLYGSGAFNMNAVLQDVSVQLNNELVLSVLCPQFIQQYKAIYPGLTMLDEGSIYTTPGGREYVTQALQVNAANTDMTIVVLYAVNGTKMVNATFTVADMVMTEDFTAYVNKTVEIFAETLTFGVQ
ncbi:MAG: hypothetical protein E7326_01405 [Clostridiales bacterium]|nr:hypothetical protein [Clostridiales bacterium]